MPKGRWLGFVLITIGAALYLDQFGWLAGSRALYLLPAAFFGVYLYHGGSRKPDNLRYLTPAAVLLAIAAFANCEQFLRNFSQVSAGWFFLFLAGGYLLIYLIHTRPTGQDRSSREWPLRRAAGWAALGVCLGLLEGLDKWGRGGFRQYFLPGLLIAAGLFVLLRRPNEGA